MASPIRSLIEREAARPVPPAVMRIAEAAMARHGGERAIVGVLFYGSCFRDGRIDDGMIDLYLLAGDYRTVHRSPVMRFWNRHIPPNVYYIEHALEGRTVRAKYALMTLDGLECRVAADVRNPYFWARFAQPTGIVRAAPEVRDRIVGALLTAVETLHAHGCALSPPEATDEDFWTRLLSATYRTELRAEKIHRTLEIYRADAERFDRIRAALGDRRRVACSAAPWWLRRIEGKLLSVARLIKASFTFQGGPDYLAWKIERHSGVPLELTDWQRRHPLLAAGPVLWRLWRTKAVR